MKLDTTISSFFIFKTLKEIFFVITSLGTISHIFPPSPSNIYHFFVTHFVFHFSCSLNSLSCNLPILSNHCSMGISFPQLGHFIFTLPLSVSSNVFLYVSSYDVFGLSFLSFFTYSVTVVSREKTFLTPKRRQ